MISRVTQTIIELKHGSLIMRESYLSDAITGKKSRPHLHHLHLTLASIVGLPSYCLISSLWRDDIFFLHQSRNSLLAH